MMLYTSVDEPGVNYTGARDIKSIDAWLRGQIQYLNYRRRMMMMRMRRQRRY
jgi:hypothetical protein